MSVTREHRRFSDFYADYLAEHGNPTCRRLHVVGSGAVLATFVAAIAFRRWWLLAAAPIVGYGFAWVGHFAFERNRPATFSRPLYSLMGDWVMFKDVLTGRIRW